MNRQRHTLHLDRSGRPYEFLEQIKDLEEAATRYCSFQSVVLAKLAQQSQHLATRTSESLKAHISDLVEQRRTLEGESWETQVTIYETERVLHKVEANLASQKAAQKRAPPQDPELIEGSSDMGVAKGLEANFGLGPTVSLQIREKIKLAASSGHPGRNWHSIFSKGAVEGVLDEEMFRKTLRRTLRLPHSTLPDSDISLLVHALDFGRQGAVNLQALYQFLETDIDKTQLLHQRDSAAAMLVELRESKAQLDEELRNKTIAWKIADACLRVNPIKGLELDALPAPGSGNKPREHVLAARRRPIPPEKLERLRQKLRPVIFSQCTQTELHGIFSRFDTSGEGYVEEQDIRRAMREMLRVPLRTISDAEIAALCASLTKHQSGVVAVDDLVDFLDGGGEARTRPKTSSNLEPLNQGADRRPMTHQGARSPNTWRSPRMVDNSTR